MYTTFIFITFVYYIYTTRRPIAIAIVEEMPRGRVTVQQYELTPSFNLR